MRLEIILSGIIVIGSTLLGCASKKEEVKQIQWQEHSFKETKQKKPGILQLTKLKKYIKNVINQNKIPYVHSVYVYDEASKEEMGNTLDQVVGKTSVKKTMQKLSIFKNQIGFYTLFSFDPKSSKESILIACPGLGDYVETETDLESLLKFYLATKIKTHAEGLTLIGYGVCREVDYSKINENLYFIILDLVSLTEYMIQTNQRKIQLSKRNKYRIRDEFVSVVTYLSILSKKGDVYAHLALEDATKKIEEINIK